MAQNLIPPWYQMTDTTLATEPHPRKPLPPDLRISNAEVVTLEDRDG
jgi:hypothetical protein